MAIELTAFVSDYMRLLTGTLDQMIDGFNATNGTTGLLLDREEELITQKYRQFVRQHNQEPEFEYLQDCLIDFGKRRMELFDQNSRLVTKEQFVSFHINSLQASGRLRKGDFNYEDFQFIIRREEHLAGELFLEKVVSDRGYGDLDIRSSKETQDQVLKMLGHRFERDDENFYGGMKSKQR